MRHAPALLCLLMVGASPVAWAWNRPTLKSSTGAVHLTGVVDEQLSIVPESPSMGFGLQPRASEVSDRALNSFTTRWNLNGDGTGFAIQAYFRNSECADGGVGGGVRMAGISAAEMVGSGSIGVLHPFPSVTGEAGGQGGGFLVLRHQAIPGQSDLSSRTDALELPVDSTCTSARAGGSRRGVLTLMAVAY